MEKLNQFPFVKIITPFCLGIYLGIFQNLYFPVYFLFLPILLFFIALSKNFRKKRLFQGISFFVLLFLLGNIHSYYYNELNNKNHFSKISNKQDYLLGYINESPTQKGGSIKSFVKITGVLRNDSIFACTGNILCYFKKDSLTPQIEYGKNVLLKSNFQNFTPPPNPFQFSAKDYYCFKNIFHVEFSERNEFKFIDGFSGNPFKKFALDVRNGLLENYNKCKIPEKELSVLKALVLGYDDDISDEVILTYSATGVMHILSVSGLHIGVVYLVLKSLLSFLNGTRKKELIKLCLLITFLWMYALVTGFSSSVVRAALMFSIFSWGNTFNYYNNIFNILAFSAFVLLAIEPFYLANVGFQLSYFALIGILLIQPIFTKIYSPKNKIINFAYSTTTVSIAATIGTLAFNLYYYHQFPVYFIPANIVAIPLSTMIIYGGFLQFLFSFFGTIGVWYTNALTFSIYILNKTLEFIENLPYSNLQPISFSKMEGLILIIFFFLFTLYFYQKSTKLFFASLLTLIVFFIYSFTNAYYYSNKSQLLIYKIKNQTAIEISAEGNSIFISNLELYFDQWMQKFHCQPYRSNNHISKTDFINISDISSIKYCSKNIAINNSIISIGKVHFLVVDSQNYSILSKSQLINNFKGIIFKGNFNFFKLDMNLKPMFIFDSTFNNRFKSKLLAKLKKTKKEHWDVNSMGAYLFEEKRDLLNS